MIAKNKKSPKKVSKLKATKTKAAAPVKYNPPKIGEYWKGQGGVYVGIRRHVENGVTTFYHLIDGPLSDADMTFSERDAWVKQQSVDGHSGFTFPNRGDGRLIDANLDRIKTDAVAFWLEQHADSSGYAWNQHFNDGGQVNWNKLSRLRARAVRRLVI